MKRLLSCLFAIGLSACGATELRAGLARPPQLSNGDGGPAELDAGDAGDAGARVAGGPEDAGPPPDAGLPEDAGESIDAGPLDAGSGPPYPIVLAHGFAGWSSIGPLDYFDGVPEALRTDGHDVYVGQVDAFNDSTIRGAQLLAFVRSVLEETGAAKVDIIAHSQGGLDARYVAHALPSGVAAIVTIATPHHGTPIADLTMGTGGGAALQTEIAQLFGADGGVDFAAAMLQMTTDGAAQFNLANPDAPGVSYYSIAGRSNLAPDDGVCTTNEPPFIARWDADLD
ncbi:MAG: esterase/lipase family protein, partial [Deltaproteobacteria bacterium]